MRRKAPASSWLEGAALGSGKVETFYAQRAREDKTKTAHLHDCILRKPLYEDCAASMSESL